jgi:plasmid stability protein
MRRALPTLCHARTRIRAAFHEVSMSRFVNLALAALLSLGAVSTPTVSLAADALSGSHEEESVCGQPKYLSRIAERFDYQVKHVPHLPDVRITDFQRVHEHRYLPESEDWPIARRYCGATAVLSDGRTREVWYLIEGRMGFAGIGENVEFCVSGFDRWMVYNGRCRVLR